jgi:hypothetical protein
LVDAEGERPEQVLDRFLRCERESQSTDPESRDEARYGIAELGDDGDDGHDRERHFADARREREKRTRRDVSHPPRRQLDDVGENVDRSEKRPEKSDEEQGA